MIRILSEDEYQHEAAPAFNRIFADENPYEASFSAQAQKKLIIYKYKYRLEAPLLDIITELSQHYGDTGFYVSLLEVLGSPHGILPHHWFVPFTDLKEYESLVGPLENAIYSPQGIWGLMGSDDWHGLLGGEEVFIQALQERLPQINKGVYSFLEYWKDRAQDEGVNIDWIPPLLYQVYGENETKRLLVDFGLIL